MRSRTHEGFGLIDIIWELEEKLERLERLVHKIIRELHLKRTFNLGIAFGGTMNTVTENVGQSVIATAVPLEADGTTVTPGAVVSNQVWSVPDSTVVSLVSNSDGTATFTAVAVGTAAVTVTGTVTDQDGTTASFTGTGTITVSAPTGRTSALSVSFGVPA